MKEAGKSKICSSWCPSLSRKARSCCRIGGSDGVSVKATRQENSLLLTEGSVFGFIQVFNCLDEAHHIRRAIYFTQYQFKMLVSSINTPTDKTRIMFGQMSGHSVVQSCWHIKLTSTDQLGTHAHLLKSYLNLQVGILTRLQFCLIFMMWVSCVQPKPH